MRMRNAVILAGIAVVVCLLAWLVWLVANYREPVYQGRPLTQWVQEYNGRVDAPASTALEHIGGRAAPWLARMLGSRDTGPKAGVMIWLDSHSFLKTHWIPAGIRQDEALKVTSMLGAENSPLLVPELAGLIRDYPGRVAQANAAVALTVLSEMGSNGIPVLIETLNHCDSAMRVQAAQILGTAPASGGADVVAALRGCLNGSDQPLRGAAALSLDLIQERQAQSLTPGTTNWIQRPLSSAPDPVSIWHISKGVRLLSSSRLAPGDTWQELFGGHTSTIPSGERETFVFDTGQPDGYVHYVEWEMPSPVTLRSFGLISANDGPIYSFMGAFRSFRLYARASADQPFALIYSEEFSVPTRLGLFDSVDFAFRNLPASVTASQFRAEFVQNGTAQYHGPRTKELFGFSEPLNSALMGRALRTLDPNTLGVAKLLYGENLLQ